MIKIKYYKEIYPSHYKGILWKAEFIGSSGNELYEHHILLHGKHKWIKADCKSRFFYWYRDFNRGDEYYKNAFREISEQEVFIELL